MTKTSLPDKAVTGEAAPESPPIQRMLPSAVTGDPLFVQYTPVPLWAAPLMFVLALAACWMGLDILVKGVPVTCSGRDSFFCQLSLVAGELAGGRVKAYLGYAAFMWATGLTFFYFTWHVYQRRQHQQRRKPDAFGARS